MSAYYVRLTVLNYELTRDAKKMIQLNKYKRLDNGKYSKDIRILCKCNNDDKATNFIMNKFNDVAEKNKVKFKIEIFKTPNYTKKISERLTKTFH